MYKSSLIARRLKKEYMENKMRLKKELVEKELELEKENSVM